MYYTAGKSNWRDPATPPIIAAMRLVEYSDPENISSGTKRAKSPNEYATAPATGGGAVGELLNP